MQGNPHYKFHSRGVTKALPTDTRTPAAITQSTRRALGSGKNWGVRASNAMARKGLVAIDRAAGHGGGFFFALTRASGGPLWFQCQRRSR
ncbi:hypothetical protein HPB50_001609 [Hyalomma asiaticum]|uniref:Uncharacterized protein n=1 Tax=Hyalomma asiaticum TaxID=266040 RepID=A0ACB7RXR2_HYAAI|nr:hypothetical protein HPB50_001609 [Hyalomma asiaticum]